MLLLLAHSFFAKVSINSKHGTGAILFTANYKQTVNSPKDRVSLNAWEDARKLFICRPSTVRGLKQLSNRVHHRLKDGKKDHGLIRAAWVGSRSLVCFLSRGPLFDSISIVLNHILNRRGCSSTHFQLNCVLWHALWTGIGPIKSPKQTCSQHNRDDSCFYLWQVDSGGWCLEKSL